ncbi:hypothetical protein [Flavobacterium sp. HBTb2-11-1]|uniref:hypothetical protein n=1 Tax=Flavobacterium sp. HBTb2-11-1 TaxID=2692212 RepID=UPI00136CF2C0|nr:hypothetical protein [Flavobacterium sp. HBTb2-11-1]MXO04363.1 hypothetical protein [Flavobacterium sp. HBTb2-11-1]
MKKTMFANVSWGSYLTVIGVILIVWYLVVLLKFYRGDLKEFFSSGKRNGSDPLKKSTGSRSLLQRKTHTGLSSSFSESFDTLDDAEELSVRILQAVKESAEKNLFKEQFQNYLRMVLEEYPYVKISSLREDVNNLIVSESEKHPQFSLTFAEADQLWEETIS